MPPSSLVILINMFNAEIRATNPNVGESFFLFSGIVPTYSSSFVIDLEISFPNILDVRSILANFDSITLEPKGAAAQPVDANIQHRQKISNPRFLLFIITVD